VFIAGVGQTAVNKDPHSRGRYLGAVDASRTSMRGTCTAHHEEWTATLGR